MSDMNISAVRGHTQALAFVAAGGTELSDMLANIATTKAAERTGPIEVFAFLAKHFTDEDGVHSIPVPGSKKGDTGNAPYDKYTTQVKTDAGTKAIPGSWYTDVVKGTAEANAVTERLGHCLNPGEGTPEDILAMRSGERKTEIKRLRQRLTDMRTALVKGSSLFLHADEISKINPERIKVRMPFKNINGKMVAYANTIRLQDPKGEEEDEVLTVSEFLRLDTSKLKGAGSEQTITTLMATKARPPKTAKDKGKGAQEIKVPTTVEGLLNLFNIAGTAIDPHTDEGQKTMSKLMAKLSAPGKEGDDAVETIGDFCVAIDDTIWSVINARYNTIKANKAKTMNVAAAKTAA